MSVIRALLLILAAAAAAAACVRAVRMLRDLPRRRLLALARETLCDAPGGTGISVLYRCDEERLRLPSLLDVGYACYEVVAVLDAARCPEVFATLESHYRLFRAAVPAACGAGRPLCSRCRSRRRHARGGGSCAPCCWRWRPHGAPHCWAPRRALRREAPRCAPVFV